METQLTKVALEAAAQALTKRTLRIWLRTTKHCLEGSSMTGMANDAAKVAPKSAGKTTVANLIAWFGTS